MRLTFFFIAFLSVNSYGQSWTLEQCQDSALVNNNILRSAQLKVREAEIDLKSSRQSVLPAINGGATHGYNWGQTIDPFTNEFAREQVQYNNFFLNSSFVLYSGLENYYDVKYHQLNAESAILSKKIEERNLKISVIAAYMQVLINDEILIAAKEHAIYLSKQREKISALIDERKLPVIRLVEISALEEENNYLIIKAQNDFNYSLLLLQQVMNTSYRQDFKIVKTDTTSEAISLLREPNYNQMPELSVYDLEYRKQSMNIHSIKSGYQPDLVLNSSIGSGYSGNSFYYNTEGELMTKPFNIQLQDNFYQSLSLTLSIPVFNRNQTRLRSQVEELKLEQIEIEKERMRTELINKVTLLQIEILNLESQLKSSVKQFHLQKQIYENSIAEYENNLMSYYEVQSAKDKLFESQSKLIQAKYALRMKSLILELFIEN